MPLSTICLPVKDELSAVETLLAKATASDVELVSEAARYILQNGGKRIRPALLLLTSKMLGAKSSEAVRLGAAIELIHAASLAHDDVLDKATSRRGRPSANVKWGDQISILVGDFLWCKASGLAISHGDKKILEAVVTAVEKTTEGEILEIVRNGNPDITERDYLNIVKLKTAELFACSCHVGAILAGATNGTETSLKNYGLNIGIAFQITDDILDYSSDKAILGGFTRADLLTMAQRHINNAKKELSSIEPSKEKDSLLAIADYISSRSE